MLQHGEQPQKLEKIVNFYLVHRDAIYCSNVLTFNERERRISPVPTKSYSENFPSTTFTTNTI